MNKTKKIALAAVSVVMAGTMALGMFGCTGGSKPSGGVNNPPKPSVKPGEKYEVPAELQSYVKQGKDADNYVIDTSKLSGVTLTTLIGYSGATTGITHNTNTLVGTTKLIDGKTYGNTGSDLKPAWAEAKAQIGIAGFNDLYDGTSTGNMLKSSGVTTVNMYSDVNKFSQVQLFTANTPDINTEGAAGKLVDLSKYLGLMPNFKHFLESDSNTYLSLMAGEGGEIYTVPYFDGNDDIEKYEIFNKHWVKAILDAELPATDGSITYKAQADAKAASHPTGVYDGSTTHVESYMGKTGSYEVDTTSGNNIVKAKVNYDAALGNAELKALIKTAAGGKDYTENSGNIVDMLNFVIKNNADAKGSALIGIVRKYIDVAYTLNGSAYAKRSDVFCSESACWDVDLFVALGRCVLTYPSLLSGSNEADNTFVVAPRAIKGSRYADVIALAGELYGVRGLESKYANLYVDKDNKIRSARENKETYDILNRVHGMALEGIVYAAETTSETTGLLDGFDSFHNASKGKDNVTSLMVHDYVQTQTANGGWVKDGVTEANKKDVPEDYDYAPVVTPVSKWDTDDNGEHETIMRFTESWRSVKNSGMAVSKAAVEGDPAKLAACLALIDYLYSNDGQIVMSYGTMASGKEAVDGFWYATEQTDKTAQAVGETYDGTTYTVNAANKKDYFVFKNKVYKGMSYAGQQIPILTDAYSTLFQTGEYHNASANINLKLDSKGTNTETLQHVKASARNYTGFARTIVGTTLGCINKQQGLEFQCTAKCGIAGAQVVDKCLNNGTIKHITVDYYTLYNGNSWYAMVPTALPIAAADSNKIKDEMSDLTTKLYSTEPKTFLFWNLVQYGYGGTVKSGKLAGLTSSTLTNVPADADACIALGNTYKQNTYQQYLNEAWDTYQWLFSEHFEVK